MKCKIMIVLYAQLHESSHSLLSMKALHVSPQLCSAKPMYEGIQAPDTVYPRVNRLGCDVRVPSTDGLGNVLTHQNPREGVGPSFYSTSGRNGRVPFQISG